MTISGPTSVGLVLFVVELVENLTQQLLDLAHVLFVVELLDIFLGQLVGERLDLVLGLLQALGERVKHPQGETPRNRDGYVEECLAIHILLSQADGLVSSPATAMALMVSSAGSYQNWSATTLPSQSTQKRASATAKMFSSGST